MPIPQGRLGYISINSVKYPAYSVSVRQPRNLAVGMPMGSTWGSNSAEGLQSTRIVVQLMFREKSAEILGALATSSLFYLFTNRAFTGGFDNTAAFPMITYDGYDDLKTFANVKAESFTLSVAKGAPVGMTAVFLAPGKGTPSDPLAATTYAEQADTSPLLMFDKVSATGISGSHYGWELTYSNNHVPNAPLDGTKVMSAWEAGVISCGFSVTVDSRTGTDPNTFLENAAVSLAMVGATTRNIALTAVQPNDPYDKDYLPGQIFQRLNCICKGSGTVAPLVLT